MKRYTLEAVENLIQAYIDKGGEMHQLEEGVLGHGLLMLTGESLKTAIIKEVFVNSWSSAHTVRFYNEMPKKYANMMEN